MKVIEKKKTICETKSFQGLILRDGKIEVAPIFRSTVFKKSKAKKALRKSFAERILRKI